jgi:hypothetical protein
MMNYIPRSLYGSFFCFFILNIFSIKAYSQDLPKELYTAAGIPDSLKEDANSVLRYNMEDVEVKGPGKEIVKVHSVVTILNEKGDREAAVDLPYNRKFINVSSFEMMIYDASGKLIKKYHKGDLFDHADENDETLVSDDRSLSMIYAVASYPTTVEKIYEIDDESFINLYQWDVQQEDQSVQSSNFSISIKNDAGFRYLDRNTTLKPQKKSLDNIDNYTWQASNLKAIKMEDGAMPWKVLPKVELGMDKFECYGYPGDFSSWQSFGKWQQTLNADVCNLNPQRVAEIQQMTAGIKTDKEKAKFLYEYMEQNVRYVNIALGIGGFKPFPADFVDQKKYGDCKALSNYMVALLKTVNINAYFAIVNAGNNEEPQNISFPYDIADHIIVCIPFKGDTTWLECTSEKMRFGHLGPFTENRNALLITEDGGKLVNTPKSKAEDNQFNSEVHLELDSDGSAKAQVKFLSTGEYRFEFLSMAAAKTEQQKEALLTGYNIKQPSAFDIKQGADNDGVDEMELHLEYDKFCDILLGNKQFYHPHVFNLCGFTVPILEKRKTDFYFKYPVETSCVTTIDLPKGFEVETMPANQSLKFTYGNYDVKYTYDVVKNQVISMAKFNITNQDIPAAKYTELQQYLDAVAKAQNKKLVIRRKA